MKTLFDVSILVSDWINRSFQNILSLMFSFGEVVTCFFGNCQNVPRIELLLTLILLIL